MPNRGFKIGALGEIAIRCNDLATMSEFYENILGLEYFSGTLKSGIIFFKIAEGFKGHTSVLALFDKNSGRTDIHPRGLKQPVTGGESSLHHIALSVDFSEQNNAMKWFEANNIEFNVQEFGWIGWRGIFVKDPEGNTIELVAYDESILT